MFLFYFTIQQFIFNLLSNLHPTIYLSILQSKDLLRLVFFAFFLRNTQCLAKFAAKQIIFINNTKFCIASNSNHRSSK